MEPVTHQQKNEAIAGFPFEGILVSENPYGSGHINDTFLLEADTSTIPSFWFLTWGTMKR